MRSSRAYVITALCVALAATAAILLLRQNPSNARYESSDDFIKQARKAASQSQDQGEGFIPGTADTQQGIPKIELGTTTLDLGLVPNSHTTTVDFPIRNIGSGDLVIADIDTTCHCTEGVMAEGQQIIKPGGQGILKVSLHPDRVPEGFGSNKTLKIRSNDPQKPLSLLDVVSKVDPEFSVEPDTLAFGDVPKGKAVSKTLRVRQISDAPFEVTQVALSRPEDKKQLEVSFEKVPETAWTKPDSVEYDVKVTLTKEAAIGELSTGIKIKNTCKRPVVSDLFVPVTGKVTAFYKLSTARLVLQASRPGQVNAGTVTIEADRPFELAGLGVTDTALTVAALPGAKPNSQTLSVSVAENAAPGVKNGEITFTVKAGDESYGESVPVQVIVTKALKLPKAGQAAAS